MASEGGACGFCRGVIADQPPGPWQQFTEALGRDAAEHVGQPGLRVSLGNPVPDRLDGRLGLAG